MRVCGKMTSNMAVVTKVGLMVQFTTENTLGVKNTDAVFIVGMMEVNTMVIGSRIKLRD